MVDDERVMIMIDTDKESFVEWGESEGHWFARSQGLFYDEVSISEMYSVFAFLQTAINVDYWGV